MTTVVWDDIGEKFYEAGVSKGVFYDSEGNGTPWNGLISIEEEVDTEVSPVHFDGVKIDDIATIGDFSAVMRAWTYPDAFLPYEGIVEDQAGVYILNQPIDKFSLSYQTLIGNDIDGTYHAFKIHILYNLTAAPSQKSYQTLALEIEPSEFEWNITAVPEIIDDYKPTAHIIFDSRKIPPEVMSQIQDLIYGDSTNDAYLPPLDKLLKMVRDWINDI
jgi:hypothetical protein